MTENPTDDQPGFIAEEPEHCFDCFRLILAGQTYYLTIEHEVLCADCALDEGVIRVREDLDVEVKRDRLLVQRGKAVVEVLPSEIRHLVNALAEAAARLVDMCCSLGSVYTVDASYRELPPCVYLRLSHRLKTWLTTCP